MHVVATAGHVDHGKSTLVRALTGMEPDRWAEERRRGMTIDLGYAWTTLPSGAQLAFVDVPGHERFLGNMLAGLGPAPAVIFVVAADEGWRRQSEEHLAAVSALGLTHGLLAVTRSDLADPGPAIEQASARLARSTLGPTPAVAVSGSTGEGLAQLRSALDGLVADLPVPRQDGRVRLWVDRAFTIRGSGTVVTGTLGAGRLRVGDQLDLVPASGGGGRSGRAGRLRPVSRVTVRSVESLGQPFVEVTAVARVALNLRDLDVKDVHRGDALVTPGAWQRADQVDVRVDPGDDLPAELMLHVGTAAVPVRLRPLGRASAQSSAHSSAQSSGQSSAESSGRSSARASAQPSGQTHAVWSARVTLPGPMPLTVGDRAILRDPARQAILASVLVLDADPPRLARRGDAARRAAVLADSTGRPDLREEVLRRGAVRRADLVALGLDLDPAPPRPNLDAAPPRPNLCADLHELAHTMQPVRLPPNLCADIAATSAQTFEHTLTPAPSPDPHDPHDSHDPNDPHDPDDPHDHLHPSAEVEPTAAAPASALDGIRQESGWYVSDEQWQRWASALVTAVDAHAVADPLAPRMPLEAARRAAQVPDLGLISALAREAGLEVSEGRVARPGIRADLSRAEQAIADLEKSWQATPFVAPEQGDLAAAGLGPRELAAAAREGRLLVLPGDVVLSPRAPALAMRELAALAQPFTVSEARQALGTTRRVAVPLLEHLDGRGWTRRVDERARVVVRRTG